MRAQPECVSRAKTIDRRERVFFIRPQALEASSKNGLTYDGWSSGAIIYAYVGGNPISNVDPYGLQYNGAPPPSDIPGGPWKWSPDPNNSRGGSFKGQGGASCSWDQPGSHWDVDDGKGSRDRFDRWGNKLDKGDPHRYERFRLPRLLPLVPRMPLLLCPACDLLLPQPGDSGPGMS